MADPSSNLLFGWADYLVFVAMLVGSAFIGVYYAW